MIKIDFYPDNEELLVKGLKTTTLRSDNQAAKIGMKEGERSRCVVAGVEFEVTYEGLLDVIQAGGASTVWESEGFEHTGGPKFKQTELFLQGKQKLHLYRFKKVTD